MVAGHFDAMSPAKINGGHKDLLGLQLLLSQQLDGSATKAVLESLNAAQSNKARMRAR